MEKLLLSWARVNVNTPAVHIRVGPLRRKGFGLYSPSLLSFCLLFSLLVSRGGGTEAGEGHRGQRDHECERLSPQDLRPSAVYCWYTRVVHLSLSFSSSPLLLCSLAIPRPFIRRGHKYPGQLSVCEERRTPLAYPGPSSSSRSPRVHA